MSDYIKDTFVRRQHVKLAAKVEVATKCQEAWKVPISPEQAAELGLPRPLLQVSALPTVTGPNNDHEPWDNVSSVAAVACRGMTRKVIVCLVIFFKLEEKKVWYFIFCKV